MSFGRRLGKARMSLTSAQIQANFAQVKARIAAAARASQRDAAAVRLVAVSKRMPVDALRAALAAGQHCFGENTVQEAVAKQDVMTGADIDWHFIGHLQSNKAAAVATRFSCLHTLDSMKLARRLSQARPADASPLQVLLQVNIADDPAKAGLAPAQLPVLAEQLLAADLPGIELAGLMTIGLRAADEAARRHEFAALRRLGETCAARFGQTHFRELSMGMSGDFELAIAEGATLVRVGSTLFGPRPV